MSRILLLVALGLTLSACAGPARQAEDPIVRLRYSQAAPQAPAPALQALA